MRPVERQSLFKVEATGHVNHLHEDWDDAPWHAGTILFLLAGFVPLFVSRALDSCLP